MNQLRRKMRPVLYRTAVVSLLFSLLVPAGGFAGEVLQPRIGETAPPFDLATLQGEKLALEDLRGKFVVIQFATSW
jgi:hypothetical protein